MSLCNIEHLSLSKIDKILRNYTIGHVSTYEKVENYYEYVVKSTNAKVQFSDRKNKYLYRFKNLKLHSHSKYCMVQSEFVIFFYENLYKLDFEFEKLIESSIEYEALDLLSIEKQAIIIHKKYIHTLCIHNHLHKTLNFTPAKKLKLIISSFKNGKLIESLKI